LTCEEGASRFHEAVEIVLEAWTNNWPSYEGKYYSYDHVEVLPKPLQAPHSPVWMAATSTAAGPRPTAFDPHSSPADLIRKRCHYVEKLVAASHSDTGRSIPMARLIAIDKTAEEASEVARRAAQWIVASYVGPVSTF
jgi:alkanesulfonate monooxygenase SsuD/methylene tetrahydromethanopterin reductase-like flavin-dependent oxidoreductase (luciferase family)